jgi:hypothetical protein
MARSRLWRWTRAIAYWALAAWVVSVFPVWHDPATLKGGEIVLSLAMVGVGLLVTVGYHLVRRPRDDKP